MKKEKAVVVLSGGQDSTTCLYWAMVSWQVTAITFDYGQRHRVELDASTKVAELAGVDHEIIVVGNILRSTSGLVDHENRIGMYASVDDLPGGVEPTFVPGRNMLFSVLAANYAASIDACNIVLGVCEEDYGGYFDCRQEFVDSMEDAINQGFVGRNTSLAAFDGCAFLIHAPLMRMTKKETVDFAIQLGCLDVLAFTHTCYNGAFPPCTKCHSCILRQKGFDEAGIVDPLITRAENESA